MNKKALVTGSSRGIGHAMAKRLAADGWEVVVHYNQSKDAAEALAAELGTYAIQADMTSPEQVKAMFDTVGSLGLLVCNAGIADYRLLTEVDEDTWQNVIGVNTDGVYRCLHAAIPAMVRAKEGCILITSSVWGVYGSSCEAVYSASKAALIGLMKSLAKELGPSGIRVNCIAPGVIMTDMLRQFDFADLKMLEAYTPLGRIGQPEDIAELAAFLASDKASFITGQCIGCDGGFGM